MEKVGIFFGSLSGNTRIVAELIKSRIPGHNAEIFDIFESDHEEIKKFTNLIFGIPTWGQLIVHDDWQGFLTSLSKINLENKKIALYGLGDQQMFSDAFADAMGLVYETLQKRDCKIVGEWPLQGYEFQKSLAVKNDKFCGLVIDEDNQSELTEPRIQQWVDSLISEFN